MKRGKKFILFGANFILFFLFLYLIFFIPNAKSNPDTGVTNCSALTTAGETYILSNDIVNNQITDNCINVSASNITLDCQGHYIYSIQNRSGVYSNSTNSTIKNCNITMGSIANINAIGIYFYSASSGNSTIFNNSIFGDSYAGIYLSRSNNNFVTSNTGISNSNYGIYLYRSNNSILTSNTGTSNSSQGIYIYSSNNNSLTSNIGTSNFSEGIYIYSSNNNSLTSNIGTSNSSQGIHLSSSNNSILTSNIGTSNSSQGIRVLRSNNSILTSNTGISNINFGIYLYGLNNNFVTSNIGTSNSAQGIYIQTSDNNSLTLNTGISNSSSGIILLSSDRNNLISNTGRSNSSGGIYLFISNSNNLTNFISSNNEYGVYIHNSNNTLITNLTAKNNSLYGIYLRGGSYNNTLRDSFIQFNSFSGIFINSTGNAPQNNYFYNNYFNNSIAFANISTSALNHFNITKTAGTNIINGNYLAGNYWAAPNGTGFSQTCADADDDGICDTAYNFDNLNYDYLPLGGCEETWSCSWGTCINDLETYTCIDSNLCQTYLLKPSDDGTTRDCGSAGKPPVKPSSSGGGGSSTSVTIPEATPLESINVIINNSGMDLTSIVLNVNEKVTNGSVSIQSKEGNGNSEIGLPIGRIYQSFEVTSIGFDNTNIINSTFNFKINKTWLEENNITIHFKDDTYWLVEEGIVGNIKLYRVPTGETKAIALTTFFSDEDETYYYFYANSPGFSTFIVFFNKYDCLPNSARCSENKVQLCLGNSTWLVTETCLDTCNNGRCDQGFFKSNEFYFLIVVFIIALILITAILLITKIKKYVYKPYSKF